MRSKITIGRIAVAATLLLASILGVAVAAHSAPDDSPGRQSVASPFPPGFGWD